MQLKRFMLLVLILSAVFLPGSFRVYAQQNSDTVHAVRVSPDGDFTAVGFGSGKLTIVNNQDLSSRTLRAATSDFAFGISELAWRPDGTQLAVGKFQGGIEIWDVLTGQILVTTPDRGYSAAYLEWSPNGEKILVGHDRGGLDLYWIDSSTGDILETLLSSSIYGLDLHPDGRTVAVGSLIGMQILDTSMVNPPSIFDTGEIEGPLAWNSTGDQLFVFSGVLRADGNEQPSLDILDATGNNIILTLTPPESGFPGYGYTLGWTPDDSFVYLASTNGFIHLWEADTGQYVSNIAYDGLLLDADVLRDGSQFVFGGVPNDGSDATLQFADVPYPADSEDDGS